VSGFPRTGPHGTSFRFATQVDGRPVTLEVRAAFFDAAYGDTYRLRARLLRVSGSDGKYLAARGISGRARVRLADVTVVAGSRGARLKREFLWPLHRAARTRLSRALGSDAGLAIGVLLGERGTMSEAARVCVRRLGISHLLAISGMHLTAIAACVVLLTRPRPRWRVPALALSLSLYAGMVGDVDSLTRAYVMSLLLLAAHVTLRPVRAVDALARTLFLMTLAAPLSIRSVGLQLSLAATFAVLLVLPVLRRRARPRASWPARAGASLARGAGNAFVLSAAVELFIAPLQIHHFGSISLVGPLATVIFLLPVTTILLASIPVAALSPLPVIHDLLAGALAAASRWTTDLVIAAGTRAPAPVALEAPHPAVYYAALALMWRWRGRWYGWLAGVGGIAASFLIGG